MQINHPQSERAKAPTTYFRQSSPHEVGDLVYLYPDRNKTRARDRYLIVSTDGAFCNVKRFICSQLCSTSYRVKKTDCYSVPAKVHESSPSHLGEAKTATSPTWIPTRPYPRGYLKLLLCRLTLLFLHLKPVNRTASLLTAATSLDRVGKMMPSQKTKSGIVSPLHPVTRGRSLLVPPVPPSHFAPCAPAEPRQSSLIM